MAQPDVSAFIDALGELEREGRVDALLPLFSADAELSNPNVSLLPGPDAARRFWHSYRQMFRTIRSEFRNVLLGDGVAMLEWASSGQDAEGDDIRYSGVSVLEYEDGRIARFRAYFDPEELSEQLEPLVAHRTAEASGLVP